MITRVTRNLLNRQGPSGERGRAGAFTPDSIAVSARHLEVGAEFVASFAVTGYPREVHAGWLQPLLTYPGRVDVSLHISPVDPVTAAGGLRKQLAKLESGRRGAHEKGKLLDPQVEAATEDAHDLAARVARGEGRLFRFGLYITVHAHNETALGEEVSALRSLAASLLLDAKPCTYRSLQGWTTTLPLGLDRIGLTRTFDTSALSAAFPFTSTDLAPTDPASPATPSGSLIGFNIGSQGLVHHDVFAADNYNTVVLGRSGSGKSFWVKLNLLRNLYRGVQAAVIDPEEEYTRLARAVGGTVIDIGAEGVRFNPFDLTVHQRADGRRSAPRDELVRRSLFLHTVIEVLLGGQLRSEEKSTLDKAITATYHRVGITSDARTWLRPAPLLADLAETLRANSDQLGVELANRLYPFTHGAFSELFSGPTTTRADGHLVVFSLRQLPEELKAVGTLLVLDSIWRTVSNPSIRRRRMIVVDEAWMLMSQAAGAKFLFRLAKSGRKWWAGLTLASQDIADVLGSELGRAVIANAATQVLLRQAPQAIDEVVSTFFLSEGERQFLLTADRGQGLMSVGTQRVAVQAIASPIEHDLVTTDPSFLAQLQDSEPQAGGHIDLDDADPEDALLDLDTA